MPKLKKNLIFVCKVVSEGSKVTFEENQLNICKGAMVVIKVERVGTLYAISSCIDHVVSLAAGKNEKTTFWHHKLSHLSKSGMRFFMSKNV